MTIAICFNCGDFKFGAWTPCTKCGALPKIEDDYVISFAMTDHFFDRTTLAQMQNSIRKGKSPHITPQSREAILKELRASGIVSAHSEPKERQNATQEKAKKPWWAFFTSPKPKPESDLAALLMIQAQGGQSVLFRVFTQALSAEASAIRKLELSYFALSVLRYVFLRLGTGNHKERVIDGVAHLLIRKSLPSSGEQLTEGEAICEYRAAYSEYDALLRPAEDRGFDSHSCTTLLMHAYERVMARSAEDAMLSISVAASLITQFIADHSEFVETRLSEAKRSD